MGSTFRVHRRLSEQRKIHTCPRYSLARRLFRCVEVSGLAIQPINGDYMRDKKYTVVKDCRTSFFNGEVQCRGTRIEYLLPQRVCCEETISPCMPIGWITWIPFM